MSLYFAQCAISSIPLDISLSIFFLKSNTFTPVHPLAKRSFHFAFRFVSFYFFRLILVLSTISLARNELH